MLVIVMENLLVTGVPTVALIYLLSCSSNYVGHLLSLHVW
jgi:hypothetical protein